MHLRAELEVHADEEFRGKCLRILKKQLPARTVAQLLYSATADAGALSFAILFPRHLLPISCFRLRNRFLTAHFCCAGFQYPTLQCA